MYDFYDVQQALLCVFKELVITLARINQGLFDKKTEKGLNIFRQKAYERDLVLCGSSKKLLSIFVTATSWSQGPKEYLVVWIGLA